MPTAPAAPSAFRRRRACATRSHPTLAGTLLGLALGLPAAAGAVDLAEVYERAKDYDATIQAALADYEAAKQQLPLARSAFLPQLSAGADIGFTYLDAGTLATTRPAIDADTGTVSEQRIELDPDSDTYSDNAISLIAEQTLYNRVNAALVDQAGLGVRQADAQFLAVAQTLILRVASAYFDVLRAQADVEFSQSELEAIGRQREQAERRFDVGLVPITDVRTAQAQYDLAVAQEIAASNQLSAAQEALRVISGVETDTLAPLADDLPLASPDPADIDAWVELAQEQNLELVGARLAREIAGTQIDVERGARWPTLGLVGTAASARTDEDGGPEDSLIANVELQLRLPLYTGGRIGAQTAQARAQAQSAEQQLLARERSATQQARDGYRGVEASISRVQALRQALVSTRQSSEATEAGFRAGTRTSIEVLQALRDVFRARSDYAGARYDYLINTLNLKAAAGTLEESDLERVNRFLVPVDSKEEADREITDPSR